MKTALAVIVMVAHLDFVHKLKSYKCMPYETLLTIGIPVHQLCFLDEAFFKSFINPVHKSITMTVCSVTEFSMTDCSVTDYSVTSNLLQVLVKSRVVS